MVEPGRRADLAEKAVGADCGSKLRVEDLKRDRAVVLEVLGEVDRGHAPAPELALDAVPVRQGRRQLQKHVTHANGAP